MSLDLVLEQSFCVVYVVSSTIRNLNEISVVSIE